MNYECGFSIGMLQSEVVKVKNAFSALTLLVGWQEGPVKNVLPF